MVVEKGVKVFLKVSVQDLQRRGLKGYNQEEKEHGDSPKPWWPRADVIGDCLLVTIRD